MGWAPRDGRRPIGRPSSRLLAQPAPRQKAAHPSGSPTSGKLNLALAGPARDTCCSSALSRMMNGQRKCRSRSTWPGHFRPANRWRHKGSAQCRAFVRRRSRSGPKWRIDTCRLVETAVRQWPDAGGAADNNGRA